jgi:ribose transport system substrate-binding protein
MNSRRTGRLGFAAVSALVLTLAATAGPAVAQSPAASASAAPASSAGAGKTIAVITPDYAAQPAAKESIDAFKTLAEAEGYTVTVVDTNRDEAAINGELTTAVSQAVDAIVLAFGATQQFGEGLANAAAAGIPVFGLDTGDVVEGVLVNVTSDNTSNGELTAQAIVDALGGEGQVAMIHFDPFGPVQRRAAAAKALFEAAGIEIIEYIQGDPEDSTGFAKATVLDLLSKYPQGDLDAVWAGWDASALGAYQATQEAGRTEVLVTGVDGQDFARAEVAKGGNWIATVRQDWPAISAKVLEIVDAHFAGTDPAEPWVYVPGILLTKDNAAL